MLPNNIIDGYINRKIEFYKDLKKFHKENIEIINSITINESFISEIETEFKDFIKLREKSNRIPHKENELFKKGISDKFEELKIIKENNSKPSIYWFEITNNSGLTNEKIANKFTSAKKSGAGWWTKVNKTANPEGQILYLGKVENNLFGRFLQHYGIAHKKTSSLKLRKWLKDFKGLEIKFKYVQFDVEILPYLEDFENIYWRHFEPILGDQPKIK